MDTIKKWTKEGDARFVLWSDNRQIGTMEISPGTASRKTTLKIGNQSFEVKKSGFWKNGFIITDSDGKVVAEAKREKWFSRFMFLDFNGKKYKLFARNNPLAEWVVQENNQDLLAYGLKTQGGKVSISIQTASEGTNYMFDFILWYLFLPIAMEQGADDYTFLLLVS